MITSQTTLIYNFHFPHPSDMWWVCNCNPTKLSNRDHIGNWVAFHFTIKQSHECTKLIQNRQVSVLYFLSPPLCLFFLFSLSTNKCLISLLLYLLSGPYIPLTYSTQTISWNPCRSNMRHLTVDGGRIPQRLMCQLKYHELTSTTI